VAEYLLGMSGKPAIASSVNPYDHALWESVSKKVHTISFRVGPLTGHEPLLRINHLTNCNVTAKFTCNEQGDQKLHAVSISRCMDEMNGRVQTSNGHRSRINVHSCLLAGGPVPLLHLVCSGL
jgi:hypothetical protein